MLAALISILAGAALNALRGGILGQSWRDRFGPPKWPALAISAALLVVSFGPVPGAVLAACLALWALPAWGRWYSLGRLPRAASGPPSAFEKVIERIGGDNDRACLLLRHCLILPLAAALAWFGHETAALAAAGLPAGIVAAYEMAWRHVGAGWQIRAAEIGTGALIGAALGIA